MFKKILLNIYKSLSSIKLAILLLVLIAFFSGLSTFIQQGENSFYYLEKLGRLGAIIVFFNFNNFFRSLLFLILITLFFINLSLCTIKRLFKEFTKQIKFRFGPDLIHIGLLLIIIAGLINIFGEQKALVTLNVGDEIKVEGLIIKLDDFIYDQYDNGSPKDWISTLSIRNEINELINSDVKIEVNKPLRIKNFSIYQNSYNAINKVELTDKNNDTYYIESGYSFELDNETYILQDVIPSESCFFKVTDKSGDIKFYKFNIDSKIKEYTISKCTRVLSSGLLIKKEPGYYFSLSGLIIMLIGFFITYIQKVFKREF